MNAAETKTKELGKVADETVSVCAAKDKIVETGKIVADKTTEAACHVKKKAGEVIRSTTKK